VEDAVRLLATLIIIILCGLPALFAGWPGDAPAFFDARLGGVPGSILAMSGLLLAFVVIAAVCGVITRRDSASDREAGQ
jgi:membrane protein implicated in regulation of membrane protease activity